MLILFIIMGLVMGSFYMVVGLRMPNNESIVKPRSHCDNCKQTLKWYDLIPVLSFIFNRGVCRYCKTKLSIWYPLIEILSGLLFGISYYLYGLSYNLVISLVLASLLIIIFVSDFKYMIILDEPLIIASIIIVINRFIYYGISNSLNAIVDGLIVFGFMFLVKYVGDRVFKRESLGGGDVKFGFVMGLTVGLKLSFIALVIGSFLALPFAFYYILKHQEKEIPYGPFLILGLFLTFIFANQINFFLELLFFQL